MPVTVESNIERINPIECRVRVQIPWNDVNPRLQQKLKELRSRARVPGFRPGKVPPKVIERMYGKSVREELARDLVQETFQTAMAQHETNPLTQPVVEQSTLEAGNAFEYAARFEVAPQLEPKDYEGVEVRRRPAKIEDAKIDEALEKKRIGLTEIRPLPEDLERTHTQVGDLWTVDVDGAFGENRISRKDVTVEIGSETGELVPGLAKQLEGLELSAVGSTKEITYTPPQERLKEEFKGQEVTMTVALREVREKVIPELDDEFAKDTGEGDTLEELRNKVREELLEEDGDEAEREARQRLIETLLERNPFEAAPSMVQRELQAQLNLFRQQITSQGLTFAQLGMSESQMAERMRPESVFRVKAFLLLDAIGKKHDIDTTDEELEEEVKEMAEAQGQNPARLRATMEKNQQLLLLRHQIRESKILDYLMEKAVVEEAPDPESQEESPADSDEKSEAEA